MIVARNGRIGAKLATIMESGGGRWWGGEGAWTSQETGGYGIALSGAP